MSNIEHHTIKELYEHRYELWVTLCRRDWHNAWRSLLHSDGTMFEDSFILGLYTKPGRQITYHLPLSWWHATDFARTLDIAPEWDRHSSDDVLKRLRNLYV